MFNSFNPGRGCWNHFWRKERWKEVENMTQRWPEGVWLWDVLLLVLLSPNKSLLSSTIWAPTVLLGANDSDLTSWWNTGKCTVCKESCTAYVGVVDMVWFLFFPVCWFCWEYELGCLFSSEGPLIDKGTCSLLTLSSLQRKLKWGPWGISFGRELTKNQWCLLWGRGFCCNDSWGYLVN